MPKLERWIVAQKMVQVIDLETMKKILELGGQIGGGWNRIHQHIFVNSDNKEAIEQLLQEKGFELSAPSDIRHPEVNGH
jgi:phospholipid N-methyltransferase